MTDTTFHVAQLNVARPQAPLTDPSMVDFVAGLPRLNALADSAPGFVWRLIDEHGHDATSLRPFGPDILVNFSVWTSIETLREYVYRGPHIESLRRRREWFQAPAEHHLVLWWVPAGAIPTLGEAWQRLEQLRANGPSPEAFTLRQTFPAPTTRALTPWRAG